jgi:hypothetical protein
VLDFTKFGIVEDGAVHCFVAAVLSGPGSLNKFGTVLTYYYFFLCSYVTVKYICIKVLNCLFDFILR